jgi:hypothetical protein
MYNMNIVNPAYAGSKENISFDFVQKQWANIEEHQVHFTFLVMEQWGIMLV